MPEGEHLLPLDIQTGRRFRRRENEGFVNNSDLRDKRRKSNRERAAKYYKAHKKPKKAEVIPLNLSLSSVMSANLFLVLGKFV